MAARRMILLVALLVATINSAWASEEDADYSPTDADYSLTDYSPTNDSLTGNRTSERQQGCMGYTCYFHDVCGRARLNEKSPGRATTDRIVGGYSARYGAWPSFATIRESDGSTLCGGVLITDKHVLTAAHCLLRNTLKAKDLFVSLGDTLRVKTLKNSVPVKSICRARRYSDKEIVINGKKDRDIQHDWMVLELEKRVKFSDTVEPACVPPDERVDQNLCYVMGMGVISKGWPWWEDTTKKDVHPFDLQEMPMTSVQPCEPLYPEVGRFDASRACWASKYPSKGMPCSGDSGGPLLCLDTERQPKRWRVAGLVSYNHGSCKRSRIFKWVSVFTKITRLITEIKFQCDI